MSRSNHKKEGINVTAVTEEQQIREKTLKIREYFRNVCGVPVLCVDSTPTTNGKDGRTP